MQSWRCAKDVQLSYLQTSVCEWSWQIKLTFKYKLKNKQPRLFLTFGRLQILHREEYGPSIEHLQLSVLLVFFALDLLVKSRWCMEEDLSQSQYLSQSRHFLLHQIHFLSLLNIFQIFYQNSEPFLDSTNFICGLFIIVFMYIQLSCESV